MTRLKFSGRRLCRRFQTGIKTARKPAGPGQNRKKPALDRDNTGDKSFIPVICGVN